GRSRASVAYYEHYTSAGHWPVRRFGLPQLSGCQASPGSSSTTLTHALFRFQDDTRQVFATLSNPFLQILCSLERVADRLLVGVRLVADRSPGGCPGIRRGGGCSRSSTTA